MLHHADSASDKLSIRRAKLRTYFQRQTLPPFEVKSINPQTSLKKWILVSIKADLSHSEKLPKQTYNHFRNVKSTIPTILTCTLSQGCPIHWHPWAKKTKTLWPNKRFYMYFHQTFSLDPLWFFFHSRIGSGHVIIWKNGGRQIQTTINNKKQQSQNTNSQRIHKHAHVQLMSHACTAHPLSLPRIDPSRIQLNSTMRTSSRWH